MSPNVLPVNGEKDEFFVRRKPDKVRDVLREHGEHVLRDQDGRLVAADVPRYQVAGLDVKM